jgi:Uma2 family endonuclease
LEQEAFHARYEAMSEDVRAELVGGVVYMPSPLKRRHSRPHLKLASWMDLYEEATPGVECHDSVTVILGPESEPQPDACLIVLPEKGGQTRITEDDFLEGPPELIAEIALSSESYDLHDKKDDYERAGVKEYLAVVLRQKKVFWFASRRGRFVELPPGRDGILRSEAFPGLWLDPDALLRLDGKRLKEVLQPGLTTPEHAAFVASLAASRPAAH